MFLGSDLFIATILNIVLDMGYTGWFTQKHPNLFPGECHAVFRFRPRNFEHVFYVPLSLRRPHLPVGVFFSSCVIFRQLVEIFWKMWPTLDQTFSAKTKKEKTKTGVKACRTRVQNFMVYLSKTAWTFGLVCVRMSKLGYFRTWF